MRRLVIVSLLVAARVASGQEGVFLTEADAPKAVFPKADAVTREEVAVTADRKTRVTAALAGALPSLWEERWIVFRVSRGGEPLGRAFVVEEIGKHRPITFVVGCASIARSRTCVMAYREAYGARSARAASGPVPRLKTPKDDLVPTPASRHRWRSSRSGGRPRRAQGLAIATVLDAEARS
jgi:hypothetical protein